LFTQFRPFCSPKIPLQPRVIVEIRKEIKFQILQKTPTTITHFASDPHPPTMNLARDKPAHLFAPSIHRRTFPAHANDNPTRAWSASSLARNDGTDQIISIHMRHRSSGKSARKGTKSENG
jgi:hypothetical protein